MHEQIKNQIKDAMRAKDAIRLEVLRGLSALFTNELLAQAMSGKNKGKNPDVLSDEEVTALIRRSVKQRKDSIEQFEKGGRADLAKKEKAELVILETFLPSLMKPADVERFVATKIAAQPTKPDKAKIGQFTGLIMKELKGKADGADVKAAVEKLLAE